MIRFDRFFKNPFDNKECALRDCPWNGLPW